MDRNYIVYGVDANGNWHEMKKTPVAREARLSREAQIGRWESIAVVGADGALSEAELDYFSDIGHRYA